MADDGNVQDQTAPTQDPQPQEPPKAEPQPIDYDRIASIIEGRVKASEESALKGYFKEQGITGDEAKAAIDEFKARKAEQAPDVDGMNRQIGELQKALSVARVENVVQVKAVEMGIDAKAIPYLSRMADLTAVIDDSGNVNADAVAEALGKVLDDLPALKPQAQEQRGFRVGGAGEKDAPAPKADDDALKRAFGVK